MFKKAYTIRILLVQSSGTRNAFGLAKHTYIKFFLFPAVFPGFSAPIKANHATMPTGVYTLFRDGSPALYVLPGGLSN
jgi:hypothetical protein